MARSPEAHTLSTLAAGLCQDAAIGLEVGPGWAWDPVRRVIRVAREAIDKEGIEYCAGVLCVEVGHQFLSRFHLFALPFPSAPAAEALQLSLDRARVSRWMALRYPGVKPWMRRVRDRESEVDPSLPLFLQFCLAVGQEPAHYWTLPYEVLEPIQWALDTTRAARRVLERIAPSPDLTVDDLPRLHHRYRTEVLPDLVSPHWIPPPFEMSVQQRAHAAHRLVRDIIAPVAETLLGYDLAALEQFLAGGGDGRIQLMRSAIDRGQVHDLMAQTFGLRVEWRAGTDAVLGRTARDALDTIIRSDGPQPILHALDRTFPLEPADFADLPELDDLDWRWHPADNYDLALEKVRPQIEELTRRLEDVLRPRKRLGQRSGFASGRKVDMRRAMAYESDPRRYNELWVRNSIPDRRSVAVSLLVDLSGSMQGAKADAALLGTILLAETLARLKVPFALNGFQDVLVPLHDFGEELGPEVRRKIAELKQEVDGCRNGGNNQPAYNDDGPCLLAAAEQLRGQAASSRLLVVVSDGLPEGRRSNAADLHTAVASLVGPHAEMDLLALGLGAGTEHVTKFYPEAVANVPLHRFAAEIGDLVERIVIG